MAEQTITIPYKPRLWQTSAHLNLRRFSVLVVHRRAGKTVFCIAELIDKALRCDKVRPRYGYIAPFRQQAEKISWDYFKDFVRGIPGIDINEAKLTITFPHNGAKISLFGADNPDSIRGAYFDGVVLDEYADFRPDVWSSVIRPMLADRIGWAIFIGTPKGQDAFFERYKKAVAKDSWFSLLLPYWETNEIEEDEINEARDEMGERLFAQEFGCDFTVGTANALIPIPLVEAAMGKHLKKPDYAMAAKIIGVDVARFGDDRSCIQKRQGMYTHEPIIIDDMDNMELADRVAYEINSFKPDAVFIDAGRGEGVIDRLRQLGYDVIEVPFGGKSSNPKCENKRCEMWLGVKQFLADGGALPDNNVYMGELTGPTYSFNSAGRICLEKKEKMKERGLKSPDVADSLALTFAQHVEPMIDLLHNTPVNHNTSHEYDPFA